MSGPRVNAGFTAGPEIWERIADLHTKSGLSIKLIYARYGSYNDVTLRSIGSFLKEKRGGQGRAPVSSEFCLTEILNNPKLKAPDFRHRFNPHFDC